VVTNQAVHELRHKNHATRLYEEVGHILLPDGAFLLSDHFFGEGGLADEQLYMTIDEQRAALLAAGFASVVKVEQAGSLALHRARVSK
jgi:hypothetical protein